MSGIEQTLCDTLKVKSKAKEDRQDFLTRLLEAAQAADDEVWESLPEPVQQWVNDGAKAHNDGQDIPDFTDGGDEGAPDETNSEEEDETVADTKSKTKAPAKGAKAEKAKEPTDKKAAAEKKAIAEKKAPAKPAAAPKTTSMRRLIKQLVVKKPSITVEALIEKLKSEGHKSPSEFTVASIRSDTRDTMRVLNDAKLLDIEI